MEKLAYSVPEMATALGIGKNTAYELVNSKGFPALKVGERRIIVPLAGLERWLMEQERIRGEQDG